LLCFAVAVVEAAALHLFSHRFRLNGTVHVPLGIAACTCAALSPDEECSPRYENTVFAHRWRCDWCGVAPELLRLRPIWSHRGYSTAFCDRLAVVYKVSSQCKARMTTKGVVLHDWPHKVRFARRRRVLFYTTGPARLGCTRLAPQG
jgi:hypothetical protein